MFVDDLITRYAPTDEFFEVTLFDGEVLKFRHIRDYADIKAMQDGAADFGVRMSNKQIPLIGDMNEYWTDNADTLATAYIMSKTIVEPQVSELEFMKLAMKAGSLYQFIVNQYNYNESKAIIKREIKEVDDAKKD